MTETTLQFEPECSICAGTGKTSGQPCVCTFGSQVHPNMALPSIRTNAAQDSSAVGGDLTTITCPACSGKGMVGGHTGQTPESYEEITLACDECSGQGKLIVSKRDLAALSQPVEVKGAEPAGEADKCMWALQEFYQHNGTALQAIAECREILKATAPAPQVPAAPAVAADRPSIADQIRAVQALIAEEDSLQIRCALQDDLDDAAQALAAQPTAAVTVDQQGSYDIDRCGISMDGTACDKPGCTIVNCKAQGGAA